MLRIKPKIAKIDGKSITQPNAAMSVSKIIDRIQKGQSVPQNMPLFFGEKLPELTGFENLSKLEQIDFARQFKKHAESQYASEEQKAKDNYNAEMQIKAAAVAAATP